MVQEVLSFALGIPHAPWKPGRAESLQRLRRQLWSHPTLADCDLSRTFAERTPNYVWSEHMWSWAASTDATHFLTIQDDAVVAPHFWPQLEAMVAACPDDVIGLEAAHPHGPNVTGPWYTTSDMLIGVAYVVPMPALRLFLAWRARLRKGAVETLNEDQLLGLWCFVTNRKIWHPVPTIVDHDVSVESTYGHDEHEHRQPTVLWTDRGYPESWAVDDAPHFGRFYRDTPNLARRWVVGATEEDFARWVS